MLIVGICFDLKKIFGLFFFNYVEYKSLIKVLNFRGRCWHICNKLFMNETVFFLNGSYVYVGWRFHFLKQQLLFCFFLWENLWAAFQCHHLNIKSKNRSRHIFTPHQLTSGITLALFCETCQFKFIYTYLCLYMPIWSVYRVYFYFVSFFFIFKFVVCFFINVHILWFHVIKKMYIYFIVCFFVIFFISIRVWTWNNHPVCCISTVYDWFAIDDTMLYWMIFILCIQNVFVDGTGISFRSANCWVIYVTSICVCALVTK